MAGNPCAHEGFREYVAAFVPQLVYYEYRLLTAEEVETARSKYLLVIIISNFFLV